MYQPKTKYNQLIKRFLPWFISGSSSYCDFERWFNLILKNIETTRLILIPMTLEVIKSLTAGSSKEVEKLGIGLDENWPRDDTRDILPILL